MERSQLDQVAGEYAAKHPKTAEFDGNTLVLKAASSGVGHWIAIIFLGLGGLATLVAGVGLIGTAVMRGGGNGRAGGAVAGLIMIVFVVVVGFFVYIAKKARTMIDLNSGEVIVSSPARTRQLVNFNEVQGFNRLDHRVNGIRVNSSCQLHQTVQGKKKPKVKKVTFGNFKKVSDFDDFQPVVHAMIVYFKPRPAPSMLAHDQQRPQQH